VINMIDSFSFANLTKTVIIFSLLLMVSGCGGRDVVDGIPRKSSNPAKFFEGAKATESGAQLDKDLAFIPSNFSGLMRINAAGVLKDPSLADLPWDSVQNELVSVIGEPNADLGNLRYLWIFLDKELPFLGGDSGAGLPLVVVLEFLDPPDIEAIPERFELPGAEGDFADKDDGEKSADVPEVVVRAIDEKRIAIGSSALVEKFDGKQSRSLIATELQAMDSGNDIQGIVDVTAYRSMFEMVTGMANAFGAPNLGPIARLPEELRKIEVSASVSGGDMLEVTAAFEDEEFVQEIAAILNDQLEQMLLADQEGGFERGSAVGRLGGLSGRDGGSMLVPTIMEPLATVGAEIREDELVSLEMASDQLTLIMKRPKNLNLLIRAMVEDGVRQSELTKRRESLEKIAAALKTYHADNGKLPPAGWVSEPEGKVRPQFNWRVGLLPELGEQELYDQFDFSLPWDAPENLKVAQQMPAVFGAKSVLQSGDGVEGTKTALRVVGGNVGVYREGGAPVLEDVADKAIWTSIVIECADGDAVNWTKPGPLKLEVISPDRFGRSEENGVMFIDGRFSVRVVRKDGDLISSVITTDGGEKMKSKDFIKLN